MRSIDHLRFSVAGLRFSMFTAVTAVVVALASNADAASTNAHRPGRVIVKFTDDVAPGSAKERQTLEPAGSSVIERVSKINLAAVRVPPGMSEDMLVQWLKNRPEVEFAELDALVAPNATPNDPQYSTSWHHTKIAAPSAWDITKGSSSVIIAILDTGVDSSHPDLAGKLVPGWNFYNNNSNTSDVYGHGTAVAGTAGAATNNNVGVASVGWNCRIMPLRISNEAGYGSSYAMANALVWAADNGARVANISYKVTSFTSIQTAAQYFHNNGGVVTVSAGNDGTYDSFADNPYIITVSATASNDGLASFTCTGPHIDVAAPGVSIKTTNRGGSYGTWSGTSFSAPVVAGVAALMKSANPGLTGNQIRDLIRQGADDKGSPGWDPGFGSGRVNAANSVALAIGSPAPPPPPPPPPPTTDTTLPTVSITTPTSGSYVSGNTNVLVTVNDNVGVVKVELWIDGVLKSSKTTAPFTNKFQANALSSGAHTVQCRAYDAAGNVGYSTSITVYK